MKKISLLSFLIFLIGIQILSAQAYTAKVAYGQEKLAIREVRRNAITGNIGWNGLTGVGITYHNYLAKQMGVELGVGLAITGIKFGGRFSYLFSEKNFSPFVSGGFMYGLGFGDHEFDIEVVETGNQYSYTVSSSPYVQIAGGIEYISNGGFLIKANLGYAILLKESNYEITDGSLSTDDLWTMDTYFGSGIVIEVSIGYAFRSGR